MCLHGHAQAQQRLPVDFTAISGEEIHEADASFGRGDHLTNRIQAKTIRGLVMQCVEESHLVWSLQSHPNAIKHAKAFPGFAWFF